MLVKNTQHWRRWKRRPTKAEIHYKKVIPHFAVWDNKTPKNNEKDAGGFWFIIY